MIIDTDDGLAQDKEERKDEENILESEAIQVDPSNNGMLTFLSARFYLKAIF
jgi:hypothetical protein